jgi:hypothetical protein
LSDECKHANTQPLTGAELETAISDGRKQLAETFDATPEELDEVMARLEHQLCVDCLDIVARMKA